MKMISMFAKVLSTIVVAWWLSAGIAGAQAEVAPPPVDTGDAGASAAPAVKTGGDAVSTTASGKKTKSQLDLDAEIIRFALARFDQQVEVYNQALRDLDLADANYRKYYTAYSRAVQDINAKNNGDKTITTTYPDLVILRDTNFNAARDALKVVQTAAAVPGPLLAGLQQSTLFNYSYRFGAYGSSRTDLKTFVAQLHWGPDVNPDLRYVDRIQPQIATNSATASGGQSQETPATGTGNQTTGGTTTVQQTQVTADQLRPWVLQDLDKLVTMYDGTLRDATTAEDSYKKNDTAYKNGQKNRPKNTAPTYTYSYDRRGRVVRHEHRNTAVDSWNQRQSNDKAAADQAQTALQNDRDLARRRYEFLKQFPLLLADQYKTVTNKSTPELPLLEKK